MSARKRLLITGGAGFIGANFVHYWLARRPESYVVVLDALTYAGNRANLDGLYDNDNFRFVHGDIRNYDAIEALMREERIDTVVHFAAESHVDRSILGPDLFLETNVMGTHNLLKAAKRLWIDDRLCENHRFHHISTDEVYGSLKPDDPPFTENTPYAPSSPYSASKAASDHLVRAYHRTYGLKASISNCSNNYGPYQFPEKLIPLMIINVLAGKDLPVYGKGTNIRDWLYVEDHCEAITLVLEHGQAGETYNVGGNSEAVNIDIVRTVCAEIDELFQQGTDLNARYPNAPAVAGRKSSVLIRFVTDRPGHDFRYAINANKIETELGFRAQRSLTEGIQNTVDWYIGHEDWWRSVLDESYRDWINNNYAVR